MKAQILKMLREADGYISGQQLCEKFGVSRTAVWKVIRQLQEEGYEVEAVRNKGYRIIDSPDVMTKEELESLMDTKWAGKNIVYYDEVDSTNLRIKQLGDEGAPEGTLAVADRQTARKRQTGKVMGFTGRRKHFHVDLIKTADHSEPGPHADAGYGVQCGRGNYGLQRCVRRAADSDQVAQ